MAYFAEINENNEVIQVISVEDRECLDENGLKSEEIGIKFCQSLFNGKWIETFKDRSSRVNFAGIGMVYFLEHDAFMTGKKPFPWYVINEHGDWARPANINDLTGKPFTHNELKYIGYYARNTKLFILCPAIQKDNNNSFFSIACTSTPSYMYPMFEEVLSGKNVTEGVVGAQIENDKLLLPGISKLIPVIDATPIGAVLEVTFEPLFLDSMFNNHPQSAGRTLHELFRLLIEWDYAHTEFGNNEMVAIYSHNFIEYLQMPDDVRQDLINDVPPQAVELYIRGEYPFQATSFDIINDPPCPESFDIWYQSIALPTTAV